MILWLWQFWTYSFLGYLLEKAFAAATHSPHQVRRCFFLMPMCPVYGLGVMAVLALPPEMRDSFWHLAWWGGLTATAVEYAVHLAYDWLLHVRFWDYSEVPGNLRGRVCLPFSVIWGLLIALALPPLQSWLVPLLRQIPPLVTYTMLLLFTADAVLSIRILQQTRDPEALGG